MPVELSNAAILFGGGLAFLLAVVQLFHDRSRLKNILLFIIFMSMGIIHIYEYLNSVTPGYRSSLAGNILLLAKFILGPSLYIFYLSVFRKGYRPGLTTLFHLVPVAVAAFYVIFQSAASVSGPGKVTAISRYMDERSVYEYLQSFGFALIFLYTTAIVMKMDVLSVLRERGSRLNVVAATAAVMLFVVAALIIIAAVSGSRTMQRMTLTLMTMFFIYWFVVVQIYPELFSSSIKKMKNTSRRDDPLNGIKAGRIEAELHQLMNVEKLYCDEDLSLKKLSGLLSLQPYQFSHYLNMKQNVNFNTYINSFRVAEAIRCMEEDAKRSLLDIAFSSGFNSKSAFYDAFTRQKGMSPAKYRKMFFPAKKS